MNLDTVESEMAKQVYAAEKCDDVHEFVFLIG